MKPTIQLITFSSAFQGTTEEAIRANHQELLQALEEAFSVRLITQDRIAEADIAKAPTFVFIASGGTEGMVIRQLDLLPHPLVLLTDGKANSLAASLELSCRVRQLGHECTILHDEEKKVVEMLRSGHYTTIGNAGEASAHHQLTAGTKAKELMQGARIGVIGQPSDWLIASGVNYDAAERRWGVRYVDIPLSRVDEYFAAVADADVQIETDLFIANAAGIREPDRNEVVKAMRLYKAIRRIAHEEQLAALTVKCFDLIPTTHTTGCLALALLNDEGIVAGCEGDLQSVFTMLLVKRLTGKDSFMANPARIRDKEILFAHCTIGIRQTRQYIIRSHFESGTGVAIQGVLPTGQKVTVVKCGGSDLGEIAYGTATLVKNQDDPQKCRTQILLHTDDNTLSHYLLTRSIANHHIIVEGEEDEVFRMNGIS